MNFREFAKKGWKLYKELGKAAMKIGKSINVERGTEQAFGWQPAREQEKFRSRKVKRVIIEYADGKEDNDN